MFGSHDGISASLKILVAVVGFYLLAPVFVVLPLSFTNRDSFAFPPPGWSLHYYHVFFADPDWRDALFTSLQVACVVSVVATVLGSTAAFGLVWGRFRGKTLAQAAVLAPMIVPSIVVAVAIYGAYLRWHLVGTFIGFVAAHTMLAVPFVVVSVSTSLRGYDRRLEYAAASLGAGVLNRLRRVTIPLLLPGILAGAVFAFVTSFDEVVVALFIQSPNLRTLPIQMFTSITYGTDPTIAAASSFLVVVTTFVILAPQLLRREKNRG